MVIFVPHGSETDPTRPCDYYDQTFDYLRSCGLSELIAESHYVPAAI